MSFAGAPGLTLAASSRAAERAAARIGITRGRAVVVAVLVVYFSLLAALGGHARWGRLGVPPLSPPFADMRSVTSGWECTRRGIAVLPTNPCDPYNHRPANYPRIWMWPSFLGLGQGATVALGLAVAAVFFVAALAVLPRAAGAADGLAYGLAVCAPAVMLGVERGNVDLALFAWSCSRRCCCAAGASPAGPRTGSSCSPAILKLFPIFAAAVLVRQPRRRAVAGLAVVLGSFGLYALLTLGTIREIGAPCRSSTGSRSASGASPSGSGP